MAGLSYLIVIYQPDIPGLKHGPECRENRMITTSEKTTTIEYSINIAIPVTNTSVATEDSAEIKKLWSLLYHQDILSSRSDKSFFFFWTQAGEPAALITSAACDKK